MLVELWCKSWGFLDVAKIIKCYWQKKEDGWVNSEMTTALVLKKLNLREVEVALTTARK